MPHISGGGSHGGGSHMRHHHSRIGRRGGSSSEPCISTTPFPGSRKFRYYDRHGEEKFMYCDVVPQPMSIISLFFKMLFVALLCLVDVFLISVTMDEIKPPKPLTPVYALTDTHIIDNINVIDNEQELESSLRKFEEKTGISPYIMTVHHSDWENSLDQFAFSQYDKYFSDEQHFLIIYSQSDNAEEADYANWIMEGIQGDDTDPILFSYKFDWLKHDFKESRNENKASVGEAFNTAFVNSEDYIMDSDRNKSPILMSICSLFFLIATVGYFIESIVDFIFYRRQYTEVPMDDMVNSFQ